MCLAKSMMNLMLLLSICSCTTFKTPDNANENVKEIFKKANIAAPALIAEVKNYYLNPNATNSCVPFKDFEVESELVREFLNSKEYEIRLNDFTEWGLDVSYYNKKTNSLFGLDVRIKNGKCSEFILSKGFVCKG